MIESSDRQDVISCAQAALYFDKEVSEVGEVEDQALSLHLSHCPRCRDFVRLSTNLTRFPGELTENELNASILRVMESAREDRQLQLGRGRTLVWAAVALAASIAAVTIIGVFRPSLFFDEQSAQTVAFQCVPVVPVEPAPGVFMTFCDGDPAPEAIVRNGGDVRVMLRSGAVGLRINPDRPNKHNVIVETVQGQVRVKGTVFTVRVDDENAWVEVFRGVVEIVPADSDVDDFDVTAGNGAELAGGGAFVLTTPKTEMLRKRLNDPALPNGSRALSSIGGTETVETEVPAKSADVVDAGLQSVSKVQRGANEAPMRSAEAIHVLTQNAQACLIERNWNCAAERYREVLARYPRRPESMAVFISLAKIELRNLGVPNDALNHYQTYQRRAPNGPLAEEALFGIAAAYRQLGNVTEEEKALRRFVARYPESSLVHKARARLKQLGS